MLSDKVSRVVDTRVDNPGAVTAGCNLTGTRRPTTNR